MRKEKTSDWEKRITDVLSSWCGFCVYGWGANEVALVLENENTLKYVDRCGRPHLYDLRDGVEAIAKAIVDFNYKDSRYVTD